MKWRIKWKGPEVVKEAGQALGLVMVDIGQAAAQESKRELHPGHGVDSGDLKNSIESSPKAVRVGGRWVVELGSRLSYAMAVHQGWRRAGSRGFAGYHFLTNGVDKTRAQVPGIVGRHKLK